MGIYFLVFFIAFLFVVSFLSEKFLFSPMCIIILSYFISTILAIPNIDLWNINLKYKTIFIILVALFFFMLGYYISSLLKKNRKKKVIQVKNIQCNIFSRFFIVVINLITVLLIFISVSKIVGKINLSNFGTKIGQYRMLNAYSENIKSIPGYLIQLYKFSLIGFYFIMFIVINNCIYQKNKREKCQKYILEFVVCMLCQIMLALLSGGRYNIITCFLGMLTIITIIASENKEKIQKTFSFSVYWKIFICLVVVILLFSSMRSLVGRTNNENSFTYISSYFGGSIPLLDKKIDYIEIGGKQFGYNTFFPVYRLLVKVGIASEAGKGNLDFTTSGKLMGNVYTALYPIYKDFGVGGVCVLQFIFGFFSYVVYNYVYGSCSLDKKHIITIILYAMHVSAFYLNSYSETFFSYLFSQTFLLELIYCLIIYNFLFKIKLKWGKESIL